MAATFEEFANGDAFNASDFNTYSMRQAIIACDNQTDRDSIPTPQEGMTVYRKDLDAYQVYTGSRWKWATPQQLAFVRPTDNQTLTTSYADSATSGAVTSLGGLVEVEANIVVYNASSGADRTIDMQILCDGVAVSPTPLTGIAVPLYSTNSVLSYLFKLQHTPSAGSHTWKTQLKASVGSAVITSSVGHLQVTEIG